MTDLKVNENETVSELVERARLAQEKFQFATQEQVDRLVRSICKAVYDQAEHLAEMAVDETHLGNVEDKTSKNRTKALLIWDSLKDKKTVGIIREDVEGIVELAKPVGIVAGICPTTNAIVTPFANAAFALKTRNAIIFSPHPSAKKCALYCTNLFRKIILEHGADPDLVLTITAPSLDKTDELMSRCDVVVATGGMGMVKAAYSSGRPAFGVGAGNVQCIVDRDIDYEEAVKKIVAGRIFDNGIICSGEQMAIIPTEKKEEILHYMEVAHTYVASAEETQRLRDVLFPQGKINKKAVGQNVHTIARMADLTIPEDTKMIAACVTKSGNADVLCKEKMFPVIGVITYHDLEEAITIAYDNLQNEGIGHSVVFHSQNDAHIQQVALRLPVSRFIVNQSSSGAAGGSLYNHLTPTTTLGCGSWGNNSISDNFTYKYLMNITRIAYPLREPRRLEDRLDEQEAV